MEGRFMRDVPAEEHSAAQEMMHAVKRNEASVRHIYHQESNTPFTVLEKPESLFTFDGSIKIKNFHPPKIYKQFFQCPGRTALERGSTVLRGHRYLCAADQNLAFDHKISIIKKDFHDALGTVRLDTKPRAQENTLYRIATLDYVKNSAITLLNGIVGPEKFGYFRLSDTAYQKARAVGEHLAELATRAQYALMLGDFEQSEHAIKELEGIQYQIETVAIELSKSAAAANAKPTGDIPRPLITRPELSHPLVIGAAAVHAATRMKDDPPVTIVGLPTGGTEYAYALQYVLTRQVNKKPTVVLLPISIHSAKAKLESEEDIVTAATAIAQGVDNKSRDIRNLMNRFSAHFKNKNIVIADDNASSGRTIQLAADALSFAFGPKNIEVSVAEADVVRTKTRVRRQGQQQSAYDSNTLVSVATSSALADAVHVLPVSKHGGIQPGTDLRKILEFNRVSKFYKNKKPQTPLEQLLFAVERKNATRYFLSEIIKSPNKKDNIYNFKDEPVRFLSNFYPAKIGYTVSTKNGSSKVKYYPSVEHAFQAAKFTPEVLDRIARTHSILNHVNSKLSKQYPPNSRKPWKPVESVKDVENVFTDETYTAGQVKVFSDVLRDMGFVRGDWFDIRLEVMADLLLKKFSDPLLAKKLIETGDKLLIEGNDWGDVFWGFAVSPSDSTVPVKDRRKIKFSRIKNGFGKNMLGLLLMEIRDSLIKK